MSDLKDPRVLFAAERTLLAWNRTSLSLIAFGFVVERAGTVIRGATLKGAEPSGIIPWMGLLFIALGAFVAFYSSRQYLAVLKTLSPAEYPKGYRLRWGVVVNIIVAILGACLSAILFAGHAREWLHD